VVNSAGRAGSFCGKPVITALSFFSSLMAFLHLMEYQRRAGYKFLDYVNELDVRKHLKRKDSDVWRYKKLYMLDFQ